MDLGRNESNECDGFSNNKMYLHSDVHKLLFNHLSMLSTHLTITDSVRQDGKDDKEQDGKGQTPCKL